ncbi:MAG: hypothetical protein WAW17_20280, partial [Rhodococcus sp. (in: high G+C Gram-positive bacteria)]|uniref:hypothetical protein n=1 Tax=Rhodococcus sp. TaxID=1831 RepID=UPI003BB182B2
MKASGRSGRVGGREGVVSAPRALLAVTVATSFFVIILGSNTATPLLPFYRNTLALSALEIAMVFCAYFVALVVVLALMARTRASRLAWLILPVALVVAGTADVFLALAADDSGLLYAGRLCTGASVALATGPAASLMVVARREKGRTMIATGSILGAFAGLVGAVFVVAILPSQSTTVYQLHLTMTAVAFISLLCALALYRREILDELGEDGAPTRPGRVPQRPGHLVAYGAGALAWAIGAVSVGVMPSVLVEVVGIESLFIASLAAASCVLFSCLANLAISWTGSTPSVGLALAAITLGATLCVAGTVGHQLWAVVLGCALGGLGQAPAYSAGLRVLSLGLDPVEQGRKASSYSCVCYAAAGMFALGAGVASTTWGTVVGVSAVVGLLGVLCIVVVILARHTTRQTGGFDSAAQESPSSERVMSVC